jgi:hypothetical protein
MVSEEMTLKAATAISADNKTLTDKLFHSDGSE